MQLIKLLPNAEAFSYNLGYGFSVAAAALVGQQLGKMREKKRNIMQKSMYFHVFIGHVRFCSPFFQYSSFNYFSFYERENCKIYPLPPCRLFPYVNLSSQFLWSWQVPCEGQERPERY